MCIFNVVSLWSCTPVVFYIRGDNNEVSTSVDFIFILICMHLYVKLIISHSQVIIYHYKSLQDLLITKRELLYEHTELTHT